MEDVAALQGERYQILDDLRNGVKPRRVANFQAITYEAAIEYTGFDLRTTQWDLTKSEAVIEKCAQVFNTDVIPVEYTAHDPYIYHILKSKSNVMSATGFIQHPEVHSMEADEYDELIDDPFAFLTKIAPRLHTALDDTPVNAAMVAARAMNSKADRNFTLFTAYNNVAEKYGKIWTTEGVALSPFDFLSDSLRSFTGITGDVRRRPEKVAAACEAILPMMIKFVELTGGSTVEIPLHMAPYMREKDFERLWWPSFKKMLDALAERGVWAHCFMEQDWMRYLDYLQDLPKNTKFIFEYGDPQLTKDKLGTDYVISGFYPVSLLKTGTKEECIDKAKELIDILAPGGGFVFQTDKTFVSLSSFKPENWMAVCDFIQEYGVY